MKFVNCTPHAIVLNNGETFEPSGHIARVSARFVTLENGLFAQEFGEIQGLPEPEDGTFFIVSAMVLGSTSRADLVAPATGHPDVKRNEAGQIISVPGFVI